jgi:hypothetical protein
VGKELQLNFDVPYLVEMRGNPQIVSKGSSDVYRTHILFALQELADEFKPGGYKVSLNDHSV